MTELVQFERSGHLAVVTLNRPEKHNALNNEMTLALYEHFATVASDAEIWACLLKANGRSFCSGHDLVKEYTSQFVPPTAGLYQVIQELSKPVICAINGVCLGGGAGIALSCDIRVMGESARFGWPQARSGFSSTSGPLLLSKLIPFNIAFEYLYLGTPILADRALQLGLVNRVVGDAELDEAVNTLARDVLQSAPLAVQAIKRMAVEARSLGFAEALSRSGEIFKQIETTEDVGEARRARAEKRQPKWIGR